MDDISLVFTGQLASLEGSRMHVWMHDLELARYVMLCCALVV